MPDGPISFEAFLQVRSAAAGVFSPDGRSLAFLLNSNGAPQVFRADAPGLPPQQLTHHTEIVRSVHWSPDGRRLLFAMDEGGSERTGLHAVRPDGTDERRLTRAPEAIHHFGDWSPDSRYVVFTANRRDPEFFDVYVLDVETGEERCVLETEGHFTPCAWSPDGSQVLLREQVTSSDDDLHLLELATGELRRITPHEGEARYLSACFAGDGKSIIACSDEGREFLALIRLDPRYLRKRPLLERRADVESCCLSRDGRRLIAVLNRDGWSEVISATLAERSLNRLMDVRLPGVVTSCTLAANGSRAAISMSGPRVNPNVWELDPQSTARYRWTAAPTGPVELDTLVEPELVRYPGFEGLEIPAWLYQPAHPRRAVVVHVHGGPEGQDRPGFNAVYQYLAQQGITVLAPNVRGSSGYGRTYSHLDDRDLRFNALRDVEHAHRWVVSRGLAPADRVAIMGASYGGFTVLSCLTRQPDLWCAGVDIVGIANFETFFRHTGPWRRKLRAGEYGDPVRDAALLRDLSPIHQVDRIRAPLMVVQGANDPRVPQVESDQMVARLRARNHPVEYLLFPDEGHGIVKIPNRIRAYTAIAGFLQRHLLGG